MTLHSLLRPIGKLKTKELSPMQAWSQSQVDALVSTWSKKNEYDISIDGVLVSLMHRGEKDGPAQQIQIPRSEFNKMIQWYTKPPRNIEALRIRVGNQFQGVDVRYVLGDCNSNIDKVCKIISEFISQNRTLTFGFIDPYSLNFDFDTIRKLSSFYIDFLILFAFGMDGNRNTTTYIEENHQRIEKFLGIPDWRNKWKESEKQGTSFGLFLARQFGSQMIDLRYKSDSINTMIPVRSDDKNLPLYHLGFFSRDPLGYKFWKETQKYASQPALFTEQP